MRQSLLLPAVLLLLLLSACGGQEETGTGRALAELVPSLTWEAPEELDAARGFTLCRSREGYTLATVGDDGVFLLVPEGSPLPADLPEGVTPLSLPLKGIYLAASAGMDMVVKLDALDAVAYSSLPAEDWTIPQAREAMERGELVYAGKYSAPDYERICTGGCPLAVENTMIYHSPEIRAQLERFGVPVLVDQASREETPLGRMEWIKLYGALLGREEAARAVYETQAAAIRSLGEADTGQTVAFFYLASNGEVKVRRPGDYVPQLIRAAGGRYAFDGLGEADGLSTMTLQWETFYAAAKEADVLIYNSTVTESLRDRAELTAKAPLLADFKAVRNGRVFCTGANFYQASMELGDLALDLHRALTGETETLTYLELLE